jgi:hypothetical protein
MRVGFFMFALCWSAVADDVSLNALRSSAAAMRLKTRGGPRGATPNLTAAKHQLRDWLEERLGRLAENGDITEFERQVNADLRLAGLNCGEAGTGSPPCPDEDFAGFLDDVQVQRNRTFVVVITGVGIECGFDHSAYAYSWSGDKWVRVWQNEQNTYTEKDYTPQNLHAVLISPYNRENNYLVLTLGSEPWCSSNWHRVYYRCSGWGLICKQHRS